MIGRYEGLENNNKATPKLQGALLTFIVLQLIYLFFFLTSFPDSLRNSLGVHYSTGDAVASWLSTFTMVAYSAMCLVSVVQLAMRKHKFLLWFQIAGIAALVGNFLVYIIRQVSDSMYTTYSYRSGGYYWTLFVMVLFWTVIWCMYFARSSRVFSYMGEDPTYLKEALFTKNVKEPAPWPEMRPMYPVYPPRYMPPQQPPMGPGYPVYGQPPYAPPAGQPVYPPQGPAPVAQPPIQQQPVAAAPAPVAENPPQNPAQPPQGQ